MFFVSRRRLVGNDRWQTATQPVSWWMETTRENATSIHASLNWCRIKQCSMRAAVWWNSASSTDTASSYGGSLSWDRLSITSASKSRWFPSDCSGSQFVVIRLPRIGDCEITELCVFDYTHFRSFFGSPTENRRYIHRRYSIYDYERLIKSLLPIWIKR